MKKIQYISGLKEIYDFYDIFLIDQWGVMHDGENGYLNAIKCIEELFKKDKSLIIISNSSKRTKSTFENLPLLGFNKEYFFDVVTSGEQIWQRLYEGKYNDKKLGKNCYHITNEKNKDGKKFLIGLEKYNYVNDISQANFILGCTPFQNTEVIDYISILETALQKKIPFICANPDFDTIQKKSKKLVFCKGTIAELYKSMGGEVYLEGKPNVLIYHQSVKKLTDIKKEKILAIGDSLFHDIKGAINFNIDSLLITSGIHSQDFGFNKTNNITFPDKLKKIGILPTFLSSEFKF